ncbi:MAG: vitamin K epoxide reductase family protein [Thermoanaerobaculia bacterium]
MAIASSALVWAGLSVGLAAACAALYGRYRVLPALLTGPAVCRLDDVNGCQVLFRTRNAALLGVPNAVLGIACYVLIGIGLATGWPLWLLFAGASAALTMSAYLAYILLRDRLECRICWAGHAANTGLWLGLALLMLSPD